MGGRSPAGKPGLVTLYHRTPREEFRDSILADGFKPTYGGSAVTDEYKASESRYAFFTRQKNAQAGYGDYVVVVKIDGTKVERDPLSGHYRVKLSDLPPPSSYRRG